MNGMRVPVVAGVGGGVGTTTVAVGLRGHDGGRLAGPRPGGLPDIVVCRGTLDSVRRVADVLDGAGPEAPPVLAVTLVGRAVRGPLRARLDLLEPETAALVLLPHVRRWCTLPDPLAEAAHVLVEPAAQLPRPLRAYAAALRELVAAVAASGRLGRVAVEQPTRPPHPDERHVPRAGYGVGSSGPPVGGFRPVAGPAARGVGRTGLIPPAAPATPATPATQAMHREPAPAASVPRRRPTGGAPAPGPGPQKRREGVRIVAPDGVRPVGVRGEVRAERIEQVG